ncbi:hypothetical protein K1719_044776 [Acacia pycnantha]|nr:hypothetical protein K1719_044776 [Acacia pycnantha]
MGRGEGEAVSPGSRIFHAPGFEYYVIAVIGVKTRIDPQVVKQGLINTLLKHPRLNATVFYKCLPLLKMEFALVNRCTVLQVKEGRKWRWNPTTVNIEDHVIVAETEPHLDFPEADRFLEDYVSNTINDVLLGVTQGWSTRYLNRTYGAVEEYEKQRPNHSHKLSKLRLRATIMVNVRPSAGIQELADMMEEKSKARWGWGNCLGFVVVPLPIISQDDDPLQYVGQAKAMIDRKKHSLESFCTFYCAKLVLNFLGIKVASAIIRRVFSNTTMAFSNVVGPMEEISCFGHPLAYIAPSTYGHPHLQALTIHFQSYYNKMTLSMAADPTVIPDVHLLCDDFQLSLKLIRDAVDKNLVPHAV